MAALTTSEIKIDGQILSRIPILIGQSNYSIWLVKIRNTLSAYGVWEIIEGTNTYASTIAADQEKWKLLDRHMLGLIASTLDNTLINHVSYTWVPPVGTAPPTFPSVAKALMDKLHSLFGITGLAGQFLLFHRAMWVRVKPQTANENISALIQLFDQLHQAGLDLPQSFRAMILLSHLPDDMFTLAPTITQTVAIANFELETVASRNLLPTGPLLYGVALHHKTSGRVRLVLIRTNHCTKETNLVRTNRVLVLVCKNRTTRKEKVL